MCHYSSQTNSELLIMEPLSLLLSKNKRNCTQRNPKIASKVKLKSNYINSYSDPSPLVLLWLSEVIINNLSNLTSNLQENPSPLVSLWLSEVTENDMSNSITNLQKNKLISNYTLILQSLTISLAMAFRGI